MLSIEKNLAKEINHPLQILRVLRAALPAVALEARRFPCTPKGLHCPPPGLTPAQPESSSPHYQVLLVPDTLSAPPQHGGVCLCQAFSPKALLNLSLSFLSVQASFLSLPATRYLVSSYCVLLPACGALAAWSRPPTELCVRTERVPSASRAAGGY